MKKITLLGAGMIAEAIAFDLANDFDLTAADCRAERVAFLSDKYKINGYTADLTKPENIQKVIQGADLVIDALPGFLGFHAMQTVINAGKNIVDIAFYPEDPFKLDALAKEKNVIAVMDCGVAPGMSNLSLGYFNSIMKIDSFCCLVGGLPRVRTWPYEYKAPFSPIDVLEEYIRPARYVRDGKTVIMPALSEPEWIDFEGIGTLEAFNTDGLRSLIHTIQAPNMIEKTLRYPGHIEKMRMLRESGFFSEEMMEINDMKIRPIDFTTRLLFPLWKLQPDEEEFTVMRISIEGKKEGRPFKAEINLLDRTDKETGLSSMARTTGFPCAAAARLILEGTYNRPGVSPPEFLGAHDECFKMILDYQKKHGINYNITEKDLISE